MAWLPAPFVNIISLHSVPTPNITVPFFWLDNIVPRCLRNFQRNKYRIWLMLLIWLSWGRRPSFHFVEDDFILELLNINRNIFSRWFPSTFSLLAFYPKTKQNLRTSLHTFGLNIKKARSVGRFLHGSFIDISRYTLYHDTHFKNTDRTID